MMYTIRQRILLTFTVIVLIGSILQLILAGRQLQVATLEFYQHHLETDVLMIASSLSEPLEHYLEGEGTSEMQRLLVNMQSDTSHDYLIVDRNYRIIGFTADTGYESINQVEQTPELTEASSDEIGADIRDDFEGDSRLYVAIGIEYEQQILGYLVLSRPMQPAYNEVYQQWFELAITSLPVVVMVIIAGLWLSGTISRPLQLLQNSAMKMANGELNTRLNHQAKDEVGQVAQSFNYMAEQIENLMKTQRSFVSNAAHELRTPLMTLKLRIEALEDDTLPTAERCNYFAELRHEIDHMTALVSSLLILARIDEGRHKTEKSITDSISALQDIARHWRIEARQAGLDYEATIPADLPNLPMNSNDLRLVLDNLLGNAIKYTQQGIISLTVQRQGQQIVMSVKDTGIGFDPQQCEQLFTRFYRSDHARAQFEGNGLGLSIVQSILEQYDASITATSPGVNEGATFTIYVPV